MATGLEFHGTLFAAYCSLIPVFAEAESNYLAQLFNVVGVLFLLLLGYFAFRVVLFYTVENSENPNVALDSKEERTRRKEVRKYSCIGGSVGMIALASLLTLCGVLSAGVAAIICAFLIIVLIVSLAAINRRFAEENLEPGVKGRSELARLSYCFDLTLEMISTFISRVKALKAPENKIGATTTLPASDLTASRVASDYVGVVLSPGVYSVGKISSDGRNLFVETCRVEYSFERNDLVVTGLNIDGDARDEIGRLSDDVKRQFSVMAEIRIVELTSSEASWSEKLCWLRLAVVCGSTQAALELARHYSDIELDDSISYSEALQWYRCAAEHGEVNAIRMLAYFYYNGCGVEPDRALGTTYYRMAADQGDKKAQEFLRVIERAAGASNV